MKLRLHQFLARAGVAKNNFEITQMIKKGRVKVDGEVVTAESFIFDTKARQVFLDGERIKVQAARYFLVNKPKGHSCQRGEHPNVNDLLEKILASEPRAMRSIFVVGRLDYDTEGLVILTNDGGTSTKILQPVEAIEKEYEAVVEGEVTPEEISRLESGVDILVEDEVYKTLPAKAVLVKKQKIPSSKKVRSIVRLTITEGKKRQVRQMLASVGHPVIALKRIRIGKLLLETLGDRWVVEVTRPEIMQGLGIENPRPARDETQFPPQDPNRTFPPRDADRARPVRVEREKRVYGDRKGTSGRRESRGPSKAGRY